jgi:hypothetical protein
VETTKLDLEIAAVHAESQRRYGSPRERVEARMRAQGLKGGVPLSLRRPPW